MFSFALTDSGCQSDTKEAANEVASQQISDPGQAPNIKFTTLRQEFGDIFHAERATRHYVFTNEGKGDLVIKNVRASCGCTQPSYPKEPIPPGAQDSITVTYNSVGKQGAQRARIFVHTNDPTQPEVELKLTGRVKVKPKAAYEKEQAAKKAAQ